MLEQRWQGICNPTPACSLLFEEGAGLPWCLKNKKHIPAASDNAWHYQDSKSAGFLFSRCCKDSQSHRDTKAQLLDPCFPPTDSNGAGKLHVVELVNLVKHLTNSLFVIAAVSCWSNSTGLSQAMRSHISISIQSALELQDSAHYLQASSWASSNLGQR